MSSSSSPLSWHSSRKSSSRLIASVATSSNHDSIAVSGNKSIACEIVRVFIVISFLYYLVEVPPHCALPRTARRARSLAVLSEGEDRRSVQRCSITSLVVCQHLTIVKFLQPFVRTQRLNPPLRLC